MFSWIVSPLRVEYIDDEKTDNGGKRYAFGTTTLQGHALAGEERFQVEWDKDSDVVTYAIPSLSLGGVLCCVGMRSTVFRVLGIFSLFWVTPSRISCSPVSHGSHWHR